MSIGGKISAGIVGTALVGVLAFAGVQVVQAADARTDEPRVLQVADFGTESYDPATVLDAQAEKAAREEAARVEAERVAAEAAAAEAARIAAEQAAAEEAARVAAEQEAVTYSEPAPEPVNPWDGKTPVPFIVDPNPENAAGGFYDVSQCPSGSASTGPDGVPYCD